MKRAGAATTGGDAERQRRHSGSGRRVRLRAANADDAAVLATVHASAFDAGGWSAESVARMLAVAGTQAMLALAPPVDAAAAPNAATGEEREVPCGMIMGRLLGEDGEILTLAVHPHFRRRGIGTRLLASLMAGMAMQGAARIILEVAQDNVAAISLYERLRFEVMGRRPKYYTSGRAQPVDALLMMRQFNCGCGG